jgi:ligand-binding sensor domain-containing protein
MPEDIVWTIAVDSKNNIWMNSCRFRQGGLVKYDGTEWTVYTPNNSRLPVNMIHGIAIDKSDNVWLALTETVTQSYLVKISNDKWDVYDENDFGFSPYYLAGIQCDSKNRVLVAISYMLSSTIDPSRPSLFIFDGKKATQLSRGDNIPLSKITIDHKDNILCFGGVWIGEQWRPIDRSRFGESSGLVVKEDPYHRIWFGTEDGIYIR